MKYTDKDVFRLVHFSTDMVKSICGVKASSMTSEHPTVTCERCRVKYANASAIEAALWFMDACVEGKGLAAAAAHKERLLASAKHKQMVEIQMARDTVEYRQDQLTSLLNFAKRHDVKEFK